jgi:hypothetical protein
VRWPAREVGLRGIRYFAIMIAGLAAVLAVPIGAALGLVTTRAGAAALLVPVLGYPLLWWLRHRYHEDPDWRAAAAAAAVIVLAGWTLMPGGPEAASFSRGFGLLLAVLGCALGTGLYVGAHRAWGRAGWPVPWQTQK